MTAEKIHDPISLLICQNLDKDAGLFSLEERKEIAQLYVPSTNIYIAHTLAELEEYCGRAITIIRGYRNRRELDETMRAARIHGVEKFRYKLKLYKVPKKLTPISSSRLKDLVLSNHYNSAINWAPEAVINEIRAKLKLQK
jgi:hypothetical protein